MNVYGLNLTITVPADALARRQAYWWLQIYKCFLPNFSGGGDKMASFKLVDEISRNLAAFGALIMMFINVTN